MHFGYNEYTLSSLVFLIRLLINLKKILCYDYLMLSVFPSSHCLLIIKIICFMKNVYGIFGVQKPYPVLSMEITICPSFQGRTNFPRFDISNTSYTCFNFIFISPIFALSSSCFIIEVYTMKTRVSAPIYKF